MQMGVYGEVETLCNFCRNLHIGPLWFSFIKQPPTPYQEAYKKAIKQVAIKKRHNVNKECEKVEDLNEKARKKKKT